VKPDRCEFASNAQLKTFRLIVALIEIRYHENMGLENKELRKRGEYLVPEGKLLLFKAFARLQERG
jgi:hypothetical protein